MMLLLLTGAWVLLSIVLGVIVGTAIRRADRVESAWQTPDAALRGVGPRHL